MKGFIFHAFALMGGGMAVDANTVRSTAPTQDQKMAQLPGGDLKLVTWRQPPICFRQARANFLERSDRSVGSRERKKTA